MDVRLSPEQRALRESVVQVVDRLGPRTVRDLADEERAAKLDAVVEASGWRELRAAAEGSAPLASAVEAAIVAEELAAGLADAAFIGPTLAADLRRLAGASAEGAAETVVLAPDLSALADGAGGSMAPGSVAIDAQRAGTGLMLRAGPSGGDLAGTRHVGTVPLEARVDGVDLTRPSAAPRSGADVAPLESAGLSGPALVSWTALGLALTCADLVGAMRGAVRLACDYVSARRQYGVPVGSFQAVQHLLADAQVAVEGSRSISLHAAWAVDRFDPDQALAAAAAAKAYCARAARTVCETAIQVHGGIGNTWECLAHVYLRRALLASEILGGVGPNLQRVLAHRGIGGGGNGVR